MSEGREPSQSPTVTGLASTVVITVGSVIESQDIVHSIVDALRVISPSLANQPIALMVFIAFIVLMLVLIYWLKRHYDHLGSGKYKAPTKGKKSKGKAVKNHGKTKR
jgi:hypothetical protein